MQNNILSSSNILASKYVPIEIIGQGKFGAVIKGSYIKPFRLTDKQCNQDNLVAIKIESINTPTKTLKHEARILRYLYNHQCESYIPALHWFGRDTHYTYLVMDYYPCTLIQSISIQQANQYMLQMLHAINAIHNNMVIHRDIKPANIMLHSMGKLFLIDFGMATFFMDENSKHIDNVLDCTSITGTPKYASPYVLSGHTPSRRDDMISIGYVYLWMISVKIDDKSWSALCERIGSSPIHTYMEYCYHLGFDETPIYDGLYPLFALA